MLTAEYVAGFFDGEGNVGIYAGGGTGRTLRAQITQGDSQDAHALLVEMRTVGGITMPVQPVTSPPRVELPSQR